MSDDFDSFLASALAPPERPEDLEFARRVQMRARLDAIERATRKGALQKLLVQLLSLAALAGGLALASRSGAVIQLAESAPHLLLAGLAVMLLGWLWIVAGEGNRPISAT